MEIIHMNGRIYDPLLGRFLQADPNIQAPNLTGSLNRYSYVMNNPLNFSLNPYGKTGVARGARYEIIAEKPAFK